METISASKHGNSFQNVVLHTLKLLKLEQCIDNIQLGKHFGQFNSPFLIDRKGKQIIIFTTTSARSDRIKQNQWDAWGIKKIANIKFFYLVLPNDLSSREMSLYKNEKMKIHEEGYISMIDEIILVADLKNTLNSIQ